MILNFVALHFFEDKNLADRRYWYLSDLPLKEGEKVLAPVGMHDRLQCASVERALDAEENMAPYDLRLIKSVAAKYGARKLTIGEDELLEFGGMRYDEKHYTPFGRLLLARERPEDMYEICGYGVTKLLQMQESEALYEEIAESLGGVLLVGEEGKAAFARLYKVCRGQECGLREELAERLRRKLL